MRKILLGLTDSKISSWQEKVKEIGELGITEIALFGSTMEKSEREKLYLLLEKTGLKSIPHVHLRNDMDKNELEYLMDRYGVKLFNTHPEKDKSYPPYFREYAQMIYIENLHFLPEDEELKSNAGICIDVSHWEDAVLTGMEGYERMEEIVKKYKVGCAHISAIKSMPHKDINPMYPGRMKEYADHVFEDLNEFDYTRKYKQYLPEIVSIELENNLRSQLEVKKYLENILE